jgi:hypothetical protein
MYYDATTLLTLPRAERNQILALAAEAAAPEYEADLALPVAERELTAFTALDGEPFLEDSTENIMAQTVTEENHAAEFHQPKAR